jgi:hypothetical protein
MEPLRISPLLSGARIGLLSSAHLKFSRGDQMKKTYGNIARLVRWAVTGMVSAVIALPVFTSMVSGHA